MIGTVIVMDLHMMMSTTGKCTKVLLFIVVSRLFFSHFFSPYYIALMYAGGSEIIGSVNIMAEYAAVVDGSRAAPSQFIVDVLQIGATTVVRSRRVRILTNVEMPMKIMVWVLIMLVAIGSMKVRLVRPFLKMTVYVGRLIDLDTVKGHHLLQ